MSVTVAAIALVAVLVGLLLWLLIRAFMDRE